MNHHQLIVLRRQAKWRKPVPEFTLGRNAARKRKRDFAKLTAGSNPLTKRQIRHLPATAGISHWLFRRFMRKQGITAADL